MPSYICAENYENFIEVFYRLFSSQELPETLKCFVCCFVSRLFALNNNASHYEDVKRNRIT
jgi:hypothetical protein